MLEVIIAGVILGVTLAFMVGPVFFLLIETALTKGIKKAFVFDFGVLSADIAFIILVAIGSHFINIVEYVIWVYSIGGILIISYGIYNIQNAKKKKIHLAENDEIPANNSSYFVYFIKGFFLNFLNVGVFVYWLATSITLRASLPQDSQLDKLMLIYFTVTVAAYFLTDVAKILTARRIKEKLTPLVLIKIEKIVGVILIIFGVLLIVRGYGESNGVDVLHELKDVVLEP